MLTFKKMHIYDHCCALNLRLRDYAKNTFHYAFVDLKQSVLLKRFYWMLTWSVNNLNFEEKLGILIDFVRLPADCCTEKGKNVYWCH